MSTDFLVKGKNASALFALNIHRGDGMALLAMNWKEGQPPVDFVGFAIEYREPGGDRYYALKNRLGFLDKNGKVDPTRLSTLLSPIQKFRWVHFPRNAELEGEFSYRVTPVFMNALDELSYGEAQEASLELRRDTYPGILNVTFTRGFVSSQAFVDRFESQGPVDTLLPTKADDGLTFKPTHPLAKEALAWMGFEARKAILDVLDEAIADPAARVRVVAYDLSEPEVVGRLQQLGNRLKVIIDDDGSHGPAGSGESQAEQLLIQTAGAANVKRQHMGKLQHNKTIAVDGPNLKRAVFGSTNFSWRGLYVQANNAIVVQNATAVGLLMAAFDNYWQNGTPELFRATDSAGLVDLGCAGINAKLAFSPHSKKNALLKKVGEDIDSAQSSVLYSLAFLAQTPGVIKEAIKGKTQDPAIFVYGIADKKVGGLALQMPEGNVEPVFASTLAKDVPEPFKSEPTGGGGIRMHHKFVVIDFDLPSARVYMGSYNFSGAADTSNGENLLVIRDRRIATSYMIEALRIFDHYQFRVAQADAKKEKRPLALSRPPSHPGDLPWWLEDFTVVPKIRDRNLFCKVVQ